MNITDECKQEIAWWVENIYSLAAPIWSPPITMVIHTDASFKGWGCFIPETGERFGGRWDLHEDDRFINYLELKAIYFALKAGCRQCRGGHVRIMTDSMTAVCTIRKQGSTKSDQCNEIVWQIWLWVVPLQIWLSAAHIPGVENTEADEESRFYRDDLEWSLNDHDF